MTICWDDYGTEGVHDELISADGQPRPGARALASYLASLDDKALSERVSTAEQVSRPMSV